VPLVAEPSLLGIQIRALAGVGLDEMLIVEGQGPTPDRILADSESVSLAEGLIHMFTKPPTAFG
jgi:Multiubiquitin